MKPRCLHRSSVKRYLALEAAFFLALAQPVLAGLGNVGPQAATLRQTVEVSAKSFSSESPLQKARDIISDYRARAVDDELTTVFEVRAESMPGQRTLLRLTGAVSDKVLLSPLIAEFMQAELVLQNDIRLLPEKAPLQNLLWAIVKAPSILLVRPEYGSILHAPTADEAMYRVGAEVLGTPMRVLAKDEAGGMRLVQAPDGRIGWVQADQLFLGTDTSLLAWNRRPRVVVSSSEAIVETEAPRSKGVDDHGSKNLNRLLAAEPVYEKEMRLPAGSILALDPTLDEETSSRSNEVVRGKRESVSDMRGRGLRLPDGRAARLIKGTLTPLNDFEIESETLRRANPDKALAMVAKHAEALVGESMDVSTLLRRAFSSIDLILPDTLSRLAYLGAPLSGGRNGSELRAGDLLFFGSRDKEGMPTISDAGIYLGNGVYIGIQDGQVAKRRFGVQVARKKEQQAGAMKADSSLFLWAVRAAPDDLCNPCLLSRRSHPFYQAPPDTLTPCRLRNE